MSGSHEAAGGGRLAPATAAELAAVPAGYAVREMTQADIEAVHALETVLFPEDAWPLRMFEDELAHPEWRTYWVVEAGAGAGAGGEGVGGVGRGEIVAYAGAQYSPRLADVQTIAVVPHHEGRGLGGFLMGLMESRARAWGATDLLLEVRVDNERAQRLYRRRGFEALNTRRGYYQDGADALIMRRAVNGDDNDEGARA